MNRIRLWMFVAVFVLVCLSACKNASIKESEDQIPSGLPTKELDADALYPTASNTQVAASGLEENLPDGGFAIYLLQGLASPGEVTGSLPLALEAQALLTIDDIVSYTQDTHQIQLTRSGYQKIAALSVPVNGLGFVVCVGTEQIYKGAFWVKYSSLSYDGFVMDALEATREHPVVHISLGYPTEAFFAGQDLRADPRILQALRAAGKLQ